MDLLSVYFTLHYHFILFAANATGISRLTRIMAMLIYFALFVIAIWGAYCVIMVWMRVSQKRFATEEEHEQFLEAIEANVAMGDLAGLETSLEGDMRAMPQLTLLAIKNRKLGFSRMRSLVVDRFQRDVLGDLEHRLSWVQTVIKAAPMVGLLGTVLGMMGAFSKLGGGGSVSPDVLAEDIAVALVTTAAGLSIAIPLVLCMASVNVRIRKMEDLVAMGLNRFFESFRKHLSKDN
jgi:biopolymer transport protein ExbB/TolQ